VRAVLDPNVLISALLSPTGRAANVVRAWQRGEFDLIVSPLLLDELERAFGYPKLRRRISEEDARDFVRLIVRSATWVDDSDEDPPLRSSDSGDDYLIALASSRRAILVSGDRHLLDLSGEIPVESPARFLKRLEDEQAD
jgi:putative PIN family toxin of toxin-antitoxin system